MRFSVWPSPAQPWDDIVAVSRHAESTGWDGIWMADHFMPMAPEPADGPMMECWSILAGLAAVIPRVRLGALVTGNTYRHPAVLANMAAAVDHIAGPGRLILGLGAGWQENEHRAYGIHFGTAGERLARLEEACQIVRGLLDDLRTTFEGKHYQLQDAPNDPKPVSTRVPLLIGGGGEKVTLKIAAKYADEWNVWCDPDVLRHKTAILERHCVDLGRDAGEIQHSGQGMLFLSTDETWLKARREQAGPGRPVVVGTPSEVADVMGAYQEAGLDEFIVNDATLGRGQRKLDTLDLFINEVAPSFR